MKKIALSLLLSISFLISHTQILDYRISPVSFTDVQIQDEFWAPKIKTNHQITIPIAYDQSKKTGRIDNFKIAGGLMEGQFCSQYPFDDSDVYKIIEAASYSLQTFQDAEMEKMLDTLIQQIALAQEEDGYLYTNRTIGKNVHEWAGEKRWQYVHELSHELYNLGHMYEAAVAHHTATGKNSLLDVAIKSADLVYDVFGKGKMENVPGHQEIEIGLVKLYRETKEKKYLDLAKFFLDIRGREGVGNPKKYDQSHLPVTEQREAVGHAVRGAYMWAAMADIAAITGDKAYLNAIDHIWHDIVDKKYYINGGIGATGSGEAFGEAYELPNMSAYCETCAGVGNALWNHRMFLMTGDAKYIDVLERTMYNNIIDGVSISGDRFFYPNPLASYGQHERSAWFGCACCPPNVARFLPSMPGYIYAREGADVYVNLYIASSTSLNIGNEKFTVSMKSGFPWTGDVAITVNEAPEQNINLKLRVPGYIMNKPVPSDLYTYENQNAPEIIFSINDQNMDFEIDEKGYININKKWKQNDHIRIIFPFDIDVVNAHPNVTENINKIAIERGPLVYCAEWADNTDGKVLSLILDKDQEFETSVAKDFPGVITIKGKARQSAYTLRGEVEYSSSKPIELIPYHLWNNRGPGEMSIWMAYNKDGALPEPAPTIARKSTIVSSAQSEKSVLALNDQRFPKHSNDHSISYLHWWPNAGTREFVEMSFANEEKINKVSVYWFDDGPHGGCRIPTKWEIQYKMDETWKSVKTNADYPISKDEWNVVNFSPVTTTGIKLLIDLPEKFAAGLYEIIVE